MADDKFIVRSGETYQMGYVEKDDTYELVNKKNADDKAIFSPDKPLRLVGDGTGVTIVIPKDLVGENDQAPQFIIGTNNGEAISFVDNEGAPSNDFFAGKAAAAQGA